MANGFRMLDSNLFHPTTPARPPKQDEEIIKEVRAKAGNDAKGLVTVVDASHTGFFNKNFRVYTAKSAKAKLNTWFDPYWTPVLKNHDDGVAMWGPPDHSKGLVIGRTYTSRWLKVPGGKFNGELMDGVVVVGSLISHTESIDDIGSGRLITVSTGFDLGKAICSICGKDRFDPECEHFIGRKYDNKMAGIIVDIERYLEWSTVSKPANMNAGVRKAALLDSAVDSIMSYASPLVEMKGYPKQKAADYIQWCRDSIMNYSLTDSEGSDYLQTGFTFYELGSKPYPGIDRATDTDESDNSDRNNDMTFEELMHKIQSDPAARDAVSKALGIQAGVTTPAIKDQGNDSRHGTDSSMDAIINDNKTLRQSTSELTDSVNRMTATVNRQGTEFKNLSIAFKDALLDSILLLKHQKKEAVTEADVKGLREKKVEFLMDYRKQLIGDKETVADFIINPTPTTVPKDGKGTQGGGQVKRPEIVTTNAGTDATTMGRAPSAIERLKSRQKGQAATAVAVTQ